MFPTPHMVSTSWETSVSMRSRWSRRQGKGTVSRFSVAFLPPPHRPPCGGVKESLTQHVFEDLVQSLCILQDEGVPLAILFGGQVVQFSPVHIQLAHPDGIDV